MRYIAELEQKVQTLQSTTTTLSAQLTLLQVFYTVLVILLFLHLLILCANWVAFFFFQRDSAGLTSQNNELRFRVQAMEQQAQLKDGNFVAPLPVFASYAAVH